MRKNLGTNYKGTNKFTFDRVFDMNTTQREVYEKSAKPIIEGVLMGFNGTVFAYGQTGSGKTHTMQGPDVENLELQGIVPRMVRTVFNRIENLSQNVEFTVKVSMAEIYMEHIKDLLDTTKVNLQVKEDRQRGIYIKDLTERYIGSEEEVYEIMKIGNHNRKTASTTMNDTSSRSHSIFIMTIAQNNLDDFSSKTGTLFLVDLAGSEKVAKTNVTGQRLDEAKGINKSLSTLGKVIHALTNLKITHVPYRESKLTRILTESLGGNAKTCLIITCSPSSYNELETVSTLRFGTAARNIKNKPKINREYTVPELKKMVAKRDQLISVLKKRIKILEEFIKENGLDIPTDELLEKLADILNETHQEFETSPRKNEPSSDEEEIVEESKEEDNEEDFEPFDPYSDQQMNEPEEGEEGEEDEEKTPEQIEQQKSQQEEANKIIKLVEDSSSGNNQNKKEIINKFLILQDQLKIERENYATQLDVLSNLKEDNDVLKSKLKKFEGEREEFFQYKEKVEQKIIDLKDKQVEAEQEASISRSKLDSVETELMQIKKLYTVSKNKIERYEEKGTEIFLEESKQNKDFRKEAIEGNESIRSELKSLHDELQQKNDLIEKIHKMPALTGDIKKIIEQTHEKLMKSDKDNKQKEDDSVVKEIILHDGSLKNYTGNESCYLSASEVSTIITKQKEQRDKI
jgi:kinesin family member 5